MGVNVLSCAHSCIEGGDEREGGEGIICLVGCHMCLWRTQESDVSMESYALRDPVFLFGDN